MIKFRFCFELYSTIGNIEQFLRLESDIMVTQFPRYDSQKGLDGSFLSNREHSW